MYNKRNKDFFQPEIFLNLYFITLIGLGPIALYFFSKELFNSANYQLVFFIILLGYLSINLGYYIAASSKKIVLSNKTTSAIYIIRKQRRSWKFKSTGNLFVIIGLMAAVIFFARAGNIPMLAHNKEAARVMALNISGNGYFLYLMTLAMYGVLLLALYTYLYSNRTTLLFVLIAIVGLVMTGTGSRRYFLWLCLYIFMARHFLYAFIPIKKMAVFAMSGLLFVNLFEMFRNPDSMTTVDLKTTFLYRFLIYISNLEKVLSAFIRKDSFEYGGTFFMDLLTALPGKQIDYQSWLKAVTELEFEGFGIPPTIMGDFYVNFGYPGIVIGCFFFGYIIRKLYNRFIIRKKSLFDVFLYIISLEIASKIITSGFSAQSVSVVWLFVFIVLYKIFSSLMNVKKPLIYK
ncbi:oligosaccharide repeat unit polymerase [Flavobacterium sp. GN10]|uniref:Oligosaccharide repeat unit polymerase n=1 Tax=Flavobacterium tagetis TaxID=2801336 RepID=A0ABS1KJ91_9FLAO|nr:O-antigen polymerase [Flavobacterium tagetis]MBL0739318.1 oligosaccharide repeat unit polymerase [Flavobacterium tagetis]